MFYVSLFLSFSSLFSFLLVFVLGAPQPCIHACTVTAFSPVVPHAVNAACTGNSQAPFGYRGDGCPRREANTRSRFGVGSWSGDGDKRKNARKFWWWGSQQPRPPQQCRAAKSRTGNNSSRVAAPSPSPVCMHMRSCRCPPPLGRV